MTPGSQNPPELPRMVRWPAWIVLILFGVTLLVALVATVPSSMFTLPLLLVFLLAGLLCAFRYALHPLRGRSEETQSWANHFPTHSDQEVQRFLRIVGESLDLPKDHWCRLRPDDRIPQLTQEAFFGDGMDIVDLIMAVEEEYALELPDSILKNSDTLGSLFDYLTRHADNHPLPTATGQPEPPPGPS